MLEALAWMGEPGLTELKTGSQKETCELWMSTPAKATDPPVCRVSIAS